VVVTSTLLGATTACVKSAAPGETGLYFATVAVTTFGLTAGYATT